LGEDIILNARSTLVKDFFEKGLRSFIERATNQTNKETNHKFL